MQGLWGNLPRWGDWRCRPLGGGLFTSLVPWGCGCLCKVVCNSCDLMGCVACQPPLAFPRQEYWIGLPFPPPGDLPNPGTEPASHTWQADSLPLSHQGAVRTNKENSQTSRWPWSRRQPAREPSRPWCVGGSAGPERRPTCDPASENSQVRGASGSSRALILVRDEAAPSGGRARESQVRRGRRPRDKVSWPAGQPSPGSSGWWKRQRWIG